MFTCLIILIEKDVVSSLLSIVLNEDRAPHLPLFLEFLKQCTHQRVTLDQWDSFLQFQYVIKVDMTGYDSESACKYYLHHLYDEYLYNSFVTSITFYDVML